MSSKVKTQPSIQLLETLTWATSAGQSVTPKYREPIYRYEHGGIVVYDSKAKLAGSNKKLAAFHKQADENSEYIHQGKTYFSDQIRKELELVDIVDRRSYIRMKGYEAIPTYQPEYIIDVPQEKQNLIFDSRFESGNLRKAIKVNDFEFNLLLENDTESRMSTQWFYFSVENTKAQTVKFNIVNLVKYESLYNEGMKPMIWSKAKNTTRDLEWHSDGYAISYYENKSTYFTLTFMYDFEHAFDKVYFAYCYTYTYSDLQNYLDKLRNGYEKILRIDKLCSTLGGNNCDIITVTKNIQTYKSSEEEAYEREVTEAARRLLRYKDSSTPREHASKRAVIITARVHPGESNSSYVMQGFLEFITGDSQEAQNLRKYFIFKIVPMLNPDGVIYGNYRCSLLGVDLNRRWANPSRLLHPTIYYTKKVIQIISETHKVALYWDLHGHSCRRNAFLYGWIPPKKEIDDVRRSWQVKLVPDLFAQQNSLFALKYWKFIMERSKESSARVVIFRQFDIVNSYTMETSFYGPSGRKYQFTIKDLKKLGTDLAKIWRKLTTSKKLYYEIQKLKKKSKPQEKIEIVGEVQSEQTSPLRRGSISDCNEAKVSDSIDKSQSDQRSDSIDKSYSYQRHISEPAKILRPNLSCHDTQIQFGKKYTKRVKKAKYQIPQDLKPQKLLVAETCNSANIRFDEGLNSLNSVCMFPAIKGQIWNLKKSNSSSNPPTHEKSVEIQQSKEKFIIKRPPKPPKSILNASSVPHLTRYKPQRLSYSQISSTHAPYKDNYRVKLMRKGMEVSIAKMFVKKI